MNHSELVEKFVNGATRGKASNMFIEGDILYSYGHHFPLLVRMPWGFIQNADKYSITTSSHQSHCRKYATCLVAFSTLQSAGIAPFGNFSRITQTLQLVDKSEARYDKKSYINKEGEKVEYNERRPESAVFKYSIDGKDRYFLSSMDGGNYFLTELPCPVDTVDNAFFSLIPVPGKYLRQGEWFFAPCPLKVKSIGKGSHREEKKRYWTDETYKELIVDRFLEGKNGNNHHYATEYGQVIGIDKQIVRGTVRHSGGDHGMLKLGNGKDWYIAVESKHVQSWGANGKVD